MVVLHERNICYRDLKPDNIMCQGKVIKLVDFNTAKQIDNDLKRAKTHTGTKFYIDPAISPCSLIPYDGLAADIYSAGILLHKMLTNQVNPLSFKDSPTLSPVCIDLLSKLLRLEPGARPTIHAVKEHAFFSPEYSPFLDTYHLIKKQKTKLDLELHDKKLHYDLI